MLDLEPGEKIVAKIRRYKLGLILQSLFLVLFVVLPPLLFFIVEMTANIQGNDMALFMGLYSLILLVAWMMFFVIWTGYYLDVLVITQKRIIDINQKGFFKRDVSTLNMDKIEDITILVEGILHTLLNFGTIKIQTAGAEEEFIVDDMPDPNKIKLVIYELQHKHFDIPFKGPAK